jgi:hypothetical protein
MFVMWKKMLLCTTDEFCFILANGYNETTKSLKEINQYFFGTTILPFTTTTHINFKRML